MAEEEKTEAELAAEAEKKKADKRRIFILAGLGLLIAILSVGGTLLGLHFLSEPAEVELSEEVSQEIPDRPAIYYPLNPPLVVNFNARGRQRLLQLEITLMMRDGTVINSIELHQPMIRNALVLLIGGHTYEELQTAEGKELLRQKCLQEIQRLLEQEIGRPGIEQVLFTNFVMQ